MKVSLTAIKRLCEEMKNEEKILTSRIVPKALFKLQDQKLCYFLVKKGKVIGFAALWPTSRDDWYEFGSLWVRTDERNRGLASVVFDKTTALAPPGATVFLITKSRKVVHEAHKRKWTEAEAWQTSNYWQMIRTPQQGNPTESKRNFSSDCRLFYTILD